jgi:hypothetical protein
MWGEPLHVHCIANYWVSAFFYRYRRDVLGMDEVRARRHGKGLASGGCLGGVCEPQASEARSGYDRNQRDGTRDPDESRFEVAREFYRKLLPEFGMKPVFDGDKLFYCVGARTAIGIEPCDPSLARERFLQQRVGFHTSACVPDRERTWIECAALLRRWTRR